MRVVWFGQMMLALDQLQARRVSEAFSAPPQDDSWFAGGYKCLCAEACRASCLRIEAK